MTDDEHTAMVKKALDAIPGYPFLPCPICNGVEGCDHSIPERATAYEEQRGTVCPIHETVLVDGQCKPCGGKSERNRRVSARWDELSAAGKHGHYETLFQVVREEVERADEPREEIIRGMTEMAERFTLRMDGAKAQIDELRECLILAVKELEAAPPTSIYTRGICTRARKALNLWEGAKSDV